MTVNETYNAFKEMVDNGCGDYEVFVRKLGESDSTYKKLEFVDIVSEFSSDGKETRVEIVHN